MKVQDIFLEIFLALQWIINFSLAYKNAKKVIVAVIKVIDILIDLDHCVGGFYGGGSAI